MSPRHELAVPKLGRPPNRFGIPEREESDDEIERVVFDFGQYRSTPIIIWNLFKLSAAFLTQLVVLLGCFIYYAVGANEFTWTGLMLILLACFQGVFFGEGLRRSPELKYDFILLTYRLNIHRRHLRFRWS